MTTDPANAAPDVPSEESAERFEVVRPPSPGEDSFERLTLVGEGDETLIDAPHLTLVEAGGAQVMETEELVDDTLSVDSEVSVSETAASEAPPVVSPGVREESGLYDLSSLDPDYATTNRYQVSERDDSRVVVSCNAPNIRVHIERGLTVDKSTRKKYPAQTIFLDGVYDGAPFLDNKARHYSFDHHSGCVRAFTLATCEQAAAMLLNGLPLSEGQWQVYINDPDMDAVLAAWVLVNHTELLKDENHHLQKAMPLIRVEGVIDAHGTSSAVLTAMSKRRYERIKAILDELMDRERALKRDREWFTTDWHEYVKDQFGRLDHIVFPDSLLEELLEIVETHSVAIQDGRVALLVQSEHGIYAVEEQLKARYGKSLGLIVLALGDNRYTLRQVDTFMKVDLTHLYKALNKADPEVKRGGTNRWGGSEDIGGSPRATGTGLDEESLMEVVARVYSARPAWYKRLWARLFG